MGVQNIKNINHNMKIVRKTERIFLKSERISEFTDENRMSTMILRKVVNVANQFSPITLIFLPWYHKRLIQPALNHFIAN